MGARTDLGSEQRRPVAGGGQHLVERDAVVTGRADLGERSGACGVVWRLAAGARRSRGFFLSVISYVGSDHAVRIRLPLVRR
jgi:hypothetical protein